MTMSPLEFQFYISTIITYDDGQNYGGMPKFQFYISTIIT